MDSDARKLTEAAIRFAQAGGEVTMRFFQTDYQVNTKGLANLVSEADVQSEQTILRLIHEQFPSHAVLAEESAAEDPTAHDATYLWVIDPLDGTNNFAHDIPHFAVSVALYREGKPLCGVVLNPAREDLYVATQGGGATWNGQPIRASTEETLGQSMVATGFYYDRGEMMRRTLRSIERLFLEGIHGIRRFGTASLDLCQVAQGRFGAYFEYELAPWDFAAGRLVVEEAGGRVTDASGAPLTLRSSSALASNGHLHAAMLQLI